MHWNSRRWLASYGLLWLLFFATGSRRMGFRTTGSGTSGSASAWAQAAADAPNPSDGYEYADRCEGHDAGAQIMNCMSRLPADKHGYRAGTIILPNTIKEPAEADWSTPVVLGPGVNLRGQGLFASSFHCTVAGVCLKHDASESGGPRSHSVLPSTVYEGFTLSGNGAAGQEILHFSDAQGVTVRDVATDGAREAGGSCIHLEDVNWWTERNEFTNVSTLYGCKIGWRFTAAPTNKFQPHPSFGYNRFLDIKANTDGPQTAFSFEGNAYVYNSTFRITINKGGAGSTLFHMQDKAEYYLNETHIAGEENGSGGYRFDLAPGTLFTYYGNVNLSVKTDRLAPGSELGRYGDDAGYGPSVPTQLYNGIEWQRSAAIPDGADLNAYSDCGIFAGRKLLHAPPAIGDHFVRVEVICSRDRNYLGQIAYLMEYPSADMRPRVWQRLKANGQWGPWREMGWADQSTFSGKTAALPGNPIAAGSCARLTASVPGASPGMVVMASPAGPVTPGLHWDTAAVTGNGTVTVPVCNQSAASVTPANGSVFSVRVIP